ncbi:hypothetical protein ACX40Y_07935 [Sphingomonas sp. RS6]
MAAAAGIAAAAASGDVAPRGVAGPILLDLTARRASQYDLRDLSVRAAAGTGRAAEPIATGAADDPAWRRDERRLVTSDDGARYAVGEIMADHRRAGPPRSALDAMLVLRIDGNRDSPALSVGGGVAGAVWEAGTRR